jgi:dTDP-glucose 4,6-dehydratase
MALKKKVLVTGSGGFILGNFIRRVFHTKSPYNMVSLDRVRDSHIMHNIYVNKDHEFYIVDIRDPHMLNVIFQTERPDIVIHGAAESFVDASIKNPSPFITSNVLGTQNIIDICLKTDVKKLVYISTDEVYGHLTSEDDDAWTEESSLNPRNTYSASKAAGELLVRAAHETHGLQYQITRCCNNYGPWQTPEKFIPKIIKNILEGNPVPIYGKGEQIRDWIHVWDKCNALLKIIKDGEINSTYNISAGQEFMNVEVFQNVCNLLGKGYDLLKFVEDRPGHDYRYSVDSTKLKNIGWKPQFKFKEGLEQTCQWYVNNQFFLKQ